MVPVDFPESGKVLERPSSMREDECGPLPVFTDNKQCVTCWKPSLKERLSILFHGKVWLGVLWGSTQPPVWIWGARTAFTKEN